MDWSFLQMEVHRLLSDFRPTFCIVLHACYTSDPSQLISVTLITLGEKCKARDFSISSFWHHFSYVEIVHHFKTLWNFVLFIDDWFQDLPLCKWENNVLYALMDKRTVFTCETNEHVKYTLKWLPLLH